MNRLAGIIVAVIGLLIAVLSILKVLPGLTQTGVVLILLGGLIIGLSFVDKPVSEDAPPKMPTAETLTKIFFAPAEVFQNLRRHPRWLAAVLIMTVLSVIFSNLFMYRLTPERVTNYAIDKTLEMPMLNDDARKQIESQRAKSIKDAKNPVLRAGQAANAFAGQVFWYAFLGAIFFLFAMAMGGKINYWQAFSAAVYASFPVAVIRFVLNSIILFIKDPVDIHPITGQGSLIQDSLNFLVAPSENPVLYTILSTFSLLMFYWIWLNVTGLKNAGERVTGTIAWSASLTIFFAMLLLGVVAALLFPSFIS
jgi:hypothetical protein